MNRETKIANLLGKGFTIHWCDLCQLVYIRCPRCGMNTCSGGYGWDAKDGKCPICPIAYYIHDKLQVYIVMEQKDADSSGEEYA